MGFAHPRQSAPVPLGPYELTAGELAAVLEADRAGAPYVAYRADDAASSCCARSSPTSVTRRARGRERHRAARGTPRCRARTPGWSAWRDAGRSSTTDSAATGRSSAASAMRGRRALDAGDLVRVGRTTLVLRRRRAERRGHGRGGGRRRGLAADGGRAPRAGRALPPGDRRRPRHARVQPGDRRRARAQRRRRQDPPAGAVRQARRATTCRGAASARSWRAGRSRSGSSGPPTTSRTRALPRPARSSGRCRCACPGCATRR